VLQLLLLAQLRADQAVVVDGRVAAPGEVDDRVDRRPGRLVGADRLPLVLRADRLRLRVLRLVARRGPALEVSA